MRIFLLDDMRTPEMVIGRYRLKATPEDFTVAKCVVEGLEVIKNNPKFDMWILDHDLGTGFGTGYQFIKEAATYLYLDKFPKGMVWSCSDNPCGRENINVYAKNVNEFLL